MPVSTMSSAVRLAADSTACQDTETTCALIMGATGIPTPDDFYVESVKNQFIAPTHPGQTIEPVAVSTPEEGWPITGLARLLFSAFGPPEIWGPGSSAWPDEPWWKLSGLFDLTWDQSPDASTTPPTVTQHGDTTYYFFETQDLPLFGPLRSLGVPEPVIDVFESFFREIVELGYDRSIPPEQPTPARLIPTHDPVTVTGDLLDAIDEGIDNAAALIGSPQSIPAPPGTETDPDAGTEQDLSTAGIDLVNRGRDVDDGASQLLTTVRSQLPEPPAVTPDDLQTNQRTVSRELAATRHNINQTIGEAKSIIGNGRTIVRKSSNANDSDTPPAGPARKTPVRDAVNKASTDFKNTITNVSDTIKNTLSGGNDDDDDNGDGGEGGAAQ